MTLFFWRCCLIGSFPMSQTETQLSATMGNKDSEMQKVILKRNMCTNGINIKVSTNFSAGF